MKRVLFIGLLILSVGIQGQQKNNVQSVTSRDIPFDANWLFLKDSVEHAERADFDDSKWRKLDVPHDWSIEDLPKVSDNQVGGPFDKESSGGWATGFTVGGTGWYRKKFETQKSYQ